LLINAGAGHFLAISGALGVTLVAAAAFAVLSLRGTGLGFVMITVALGAGLAGFAGIMGAPILSVYPGLDQDMLPLALVVVILGGTGSLLGSFFGSIVVGFIYNFGQALLPELAYFVLFLPMLLVLIFRPQGLFGRQLS
jgi:branched-subunit amino acid ABC-type transport system permease component